MDKKNLNRYLDITEETLDILIKIYHTYGNIEKKIILLLIMNSSKNELKEAIMNSTEDDLEVQKNYEKIVVNTNRSLTSIRGISRATGIPRSTVTRIIKEFEEKKLIKKDNNRILIGENFRPAMKGFYEELFKYFESVKNKF